MNAARASVATLMLGIGTAPAAVSQAWNDSTALRLVEQAVARRAVEQADSGLREFHARAHGFVFFLGQLGEGFNDPPKLIKTDQLESEVYWRAPGLSKQRIVGWRDRADLPSDIRYHRDHLGIVQNGFADHIRIGEGDEVRDVPHPLSRAGATLYDFAVGDSLTIELPERSIHAYELLVRPQDFNQPRVVGAVYLDAATAELVRFRFSFTRAAYLDATLEDITILLENAIWSGRFWLPRRQEIEIRRRTSMLDLPARGIIKGRWEIGEYDLNPGLPDSLFRGPEIVAAPPAARDSFPWQVPLRDAVRALEESRDDNLDLNQVRAQAADLAAGHLLNRLATSRPAAGSISDIVHFNRVEGLALGAGYRVRPALHVTVTGRASYGVSDERLKGGLTLDVTLAAFTVTAAAGRRVADVGDQPVASGVVNSLSAQEGGADFGDYVLLDDASLSVSRRWPSGGHVTLGFGVERTLSMGVATTAARGTFRPNPALGDSAMGTVSLAAEFHGGGGTASASWSVAPAVRVGTSPPLGATNALAEPRWYQRSTVVARVRVPTGAGTLDVSGVAGRITGDPPRFRAFVLGGRGTLLGEPFRAYGGRALALGRIEWGWPVPFPALPIGTLGTTGSEAILAPFVAVGWAGDPIAGTPWIAADGPKPVAGIALEVFHRLLRAELGVALRSGDIGFSVDVLRDLWPIL